MILAIDLDTFLVTAIPNPLRFKAGNFTPVNISLYRGGELQPLPDGITFELAFKYASQRTGGLLAYLNNFGMAVNNVNGQLNCSSQSLLSAFGLADDLPGNDVLEIPVDGEVVWNVNGQKFRSLTFSAVIESPITDCIPVPTPDPMLYPAPEQIALKSEIPHLPTFGSAAFLNAGVANGVAQLGPDSRLLSVQAPASFTSQAAPSGDSSLTDGLIADWPFADANPLADASGNGWDLSDNNGVSFSNGEANFDGTNCLISPNLKSDSVGAPDGSFTLATAIYFDALPTSIQGLLCQWSGGGWINLCTSWLGDDPTRVVGAIGHDGLDNVESNSSLQIGWNTLVFLWDGTQLKLVLNGETTATPRNDFVENPPQVTNPDIGLILGATEGGYSQYLVGKMRRVRLWNRALSDAEISSLTL